MLSYKSRKLFLLALVSALIVSSYATRSSSKATPERSTSAVATATVADATAAKASPSGSGEKNSLNKPPKSNVPALWPGFGFPGPMEALKSLFSNSITSRVSNYLSSAAPVVLMMGLGALLVPVLGLDSLLRVVKRREMPAIPNGFQTYINTVHDVLQKVTSALEKMEKRYGH